MNSDYLSRLYFKSEDIRTKRLLFEDMENGRFKRITKDCAGKKNVPVVLIQTKGNGTRETFYGIQLLHADFGEIGNYWATVYLYNDDRSIAYPRRFAPSKDRILIDIWRK